MRLLLGDPNYHKKNVSLFFFTKYKNEQKDTIVDKEKIKKSKFCKNKKLFKIDDIEVDKILISKKDTQGK